MKTSNIVAIALLSLSSALGCSSAGGAQGAAESDVSASTIETSLPGDWHAAANISANAPFTSVSLRADRTYDSTTKCQSSGAMACNSISVAHGTWAVQKSGPELGAPAGKLQITFTDSFDQSQTFFVDATSKTLTLRPSIIGTEFDYVRSNATAKEGEKCGGNVLGAKDCAPGLTCVYGDSKVAGTPGTCQALAQEGEQCRGNVLGAKDCAPGLTCVFGDSPVAGTPGTCQ